MIAGHGSAFSSAQCSNRIVSAAMDSFLHDPYTVLLSACMLCSIALRCVALCLLWCPVLL